LGDVTRRTATSEYRDPQKLLARTYITNGLRELLVRVLVTLDVLNADLAATDALIDRIVYALYGLGPDEIAIIEGALQ